VLAQLSSIVDYFSSVYGKYPFGDTGAIVVNDPSLDYALETATRPLFDSAPDAPTLAHELAHQWFGDDVTLQRWRDIWLNEGFAEFSSWLWQAHHGGQLLTRHLASLLAKPPQDSEEWAPPPGNPGAADQIFANSVYDRGAGALEALREKVGDTAFFKVLRGWVTAHHYATATVQQFTAYAQKVTGKNLTSFFNTWLYRAGKP
jgi:aminopeptidase N